MIKILDLLSCLAFAILGGVVLLAAIWLGVQLIDYLHQLLAAL